MAKFTVTRSGYFYGKHFAAGTVIEMKPEQAKYELMAGNLEEASPDAASVPCPKGGAQMKSARARSRRILG